MGADRKLATAEEIERYFQLIAARSDRVRVVDVGITTEGHRTPAAIISAPENIRNLEQLRATNQRLADPRGLPAEEARRLAASQKVVVAIGASIHASEIGASQAANELLYTLASGSDAATLHVLENVVVLLIPMLNPDGHRLVTDWYLKTLGTPYEGGPMPWLYQKYAGHDINRDAFMMNLAENRNLAAFLYGRWHPQVFLTMHQMEPNGPRFFVPPNTDPIDLNYDPLIWRTAALLGDAMALEMQRTGLSGVVSSAKYDYYWPGFEDSAPLGHNTVCLLTEVASVNIATPITVPRAELRAGFKGLPDYAPQINFPDPWPGGLWTLRDIVDYDLTAVRGLLTAAAAYRETLVQNFYTMGRRAIEAGRRGGPYAYILPPGQFDALAAKKLETLLIEGGVEIVRSLEPFVAGNDSYPEGTDIIFLAQPFRAYIKTLMETQRYPARRAQPSGAPDRPYDVAGWTLPAQMGVQVVTVSGPFEAPPTSKLTSVSLRPGRLWGERKPTYWLIDAHGNAGAIAVNRLVAAGAAPSWTTTPIELDGFRFEPGSLLLPHSKQMEPIIAALVRDLGLRVDGGKGKLPQAPTLPAGRARVGLYRPWVENIDEGWTRFVLEQHEFRYETITDAVIRAGDLRSRFDGIVIPSASTERLLSGYSADLVPAEYAGGLRPIGVEALKAFVQAGGTLICLGQSTALAASAFDLAVRDVARDNEDRVFIPGSIVRIQIDQSHPLGFGLPRDSAAFFGFSSAFDAGEGVDAVVRYAPKDMLISGWLEGEPVIAGRAAALQARAGEGRIVLFGFPVQHRGQSLATFRLLFNAIQTTPPPPPPTPPRKRR